MRKRVALVGVGAAVCVLASLPSTAQAVGTLKADYEMNEGPGATVMTDSTNDGTPLNGSIVASDQITTGVVNYDGAIGYHWLRKGPNEPPADPRRVIQVPDNIDLEPGSGYASFTIEIRYRTKEKFGNITQKGQSETRGGQWKIQNPQGMPSCLFKGSLGRSATRVPFPINDNLWHVLTCELTPTRVTAYVDGTEASHHNGSVGTVDNSIPMTVGGKINCDQVEITCDYFSGDIDYIKIFKS